MHPVRQKTAQVQPSILKKAAGRLEDSILLSPWRCHAQIHPIPSCCCTEAAGFPAPIIRAPKRLHYKVQISPQGERDSSPTIRQGLPGSLGVQGVRLKRPPILVSGRPATFSKGLQGPLQASEELLLVVLHEMVWHHSNDCVGERGRFLAQQRLYAPTVHASSPGFAEACDLNTITVKSEGYASA